jgi:Zn-dependent M28 family amino/carboxypeptidase
MADIRADRERMFNDVEFMTALRPYRNHLNLESLERVANYIQNAFEQAGLAVGEQKWIADGEEYKNVIGTFNKKENARRLVVGAHYDVCGDQPGADDNASAVAGLLETARNVAATNPDIDYQIDFVAYCLEEPPHFASDSMGSYVHAKSLCDNGIDVIGMVCYEMIGYFSDESNSQDTLGLLPENEEAKGNFIITQSIDEFQNFNNAVHSLMKWNMEIPAVEVNLSLENSLFAGMSDHRSYLHFGYPSLMVNDTAFLRNPNYHMPSDTIDTLDFDKMAEVVNGCSHAVVNLA